MSLLSAAQNITSKCSRRNIPYQGQYRLRKGNSGTKKWKVGKGESKERERKARGGEREERRKGRAEGKS